jgi:hypothetical protein
VKRNVAQLIGARLLSRDSNYACAGSPGVCVANACHGSVKFPCVTRLPEDGVACGWTPTLRFLPKLEAQCSAADTSMATTKRCCLRLLCHRALVWSTPSMGSLRRLPMGVVCYRTVPTVLFIFFEVSHIKPFLSFAIALVRFHFLQQACAEGIWELATCRHARKANRNRSSCTPP